MRLIRITDADGDARFDGTINSDVVVERGSKMCIEGLTLEIDESEIQLVQGNDDITYSQDGFTYSTDLPTKTYSTNEGDVLLDRITNDLNSDALYYPENSLPQTNKTLGIEFRAAVNNTGKVSLEARKGELGELATGPNGAWEYDDRIIFTDNGPPAQIYWGVNSAVPDGECRVAEVQKFHAPKGSSYMEATIYNAVSGGVATTPDRNGVWLCYTTEDLNDVPVLDLEAALETPEGRIKYCRYGVGAKILAGNQIQAISIENGLEADLGAPTTTAVTQGTISNPRIRLTRGADGVIASTWNIDVPVAVNDALTDFEALGSKKLWQFVVFWDRSTYIQISQVQASISPFANDTITSYSKEEDADLALGAPGIKPIYHPPQGIDLAFNKYQPVYATSANFFQFASTSLSRFLGFRYSRIPLAGTRTAINFVANASYRYGPRLLNDTIIVLSENVPLVSYDTTQTGFDGAGQQRSILAVVPVSRANNGDVRYIGDKTWLDIKNEQALTFRNLRFRLTNGDYSPLRTYGQSSLTLLIKGPGE